MLDFKDKLEKEIVDYFIKYNVDPNPESKKIVKFDIENQIHYTNSLGSDSNLNVVVSKSLLTETQKNKALEIIKTWQENKQPFTWVVASNSQDTKEKDFFSQLGFSYSEQIVAMILDLKNFNQATALNDNEKIHSVESMADIEKVRVVIKSAFSLNLIDLQKYYGLHQLRKVQKIDYQIYLTVDDVPASTGQFYFQDGLAVIDDIATDPKFQRRGLAKKVLHHLLNTAKAMNYQQAALIATPDGFPVYQKLGFKPIQLYFDVYEINY